MTLRAFAFLDTNVLIHGKPIEQVDWPKVLGAEEVVLVLAITVIGELDKLKDGAEGRLSRSRAREFMSRYRKYEEEVSTGGIAKVRDRVWLRVLGREPQIRAGFDPDREDDRIINAILDFDAAGSRVLLISRDMGIRIKAGANGIEKMMLPEELELKAEPDEVERELSQTKKELERLRHRVPRITLGFLQDDAATNHVETRLRMPRARTEEEIEYEVELEFERCSRKLEQQKTKRVSALGAVFAVKQEDVTPHIEAYRNYLGNLEVSVRERWRRFPVHLLLCNDGTVRSEQVEIDICVESPFEFGPYKTGPVLPSRPILRPRFAAFEVLSPPELGRPFIEPPGQDAPNVFRYEVNYLLTDLMHHDSVELLPFDVHIPFDWLGQGFALDVTVRVAELVEPQKFKLHVKTEIVSSAPVVVPTGEEAPEHEGRGTDP
ncbi:MAG: hypothetical protein KKC99_13155 [Proteobacteria bacterium]|nr:hypothetical protein [Pseudomonadota bacterium]